MIALNNFWGKETKKRTNQCDWLMIPPPSRQMEWQTKNTPFTIVIIKEEEDESFCKLLRRNNELLFQSLQILGVTQTDNSVWTNILCYKDDLFHGLHLHTSPPPQNPPAILPFSSDCNTNPN